MHEELIVFLPLFMGATLKHVPIISQQLRMWRRNAHTLRP